MNSTVKSIYLIRHGQSLANTGAVSMPDATIPLTERGTHQALDLLKRWQANGLPQPSCIYHSELLRAKQTAQVFANHFATTPATMSTTKPTTMPQLNELCCLGYSTVTGMIGKQRAPLAQRYWQTADIHHRDAPDADTFAEFMARVDDFIKLTSSLEHHTLCFGHGIWIGLLAYRLLGCEVKTNADIQKFRQFQTAMPMYNTVVYRLDIGKGGVMQLRVVNELKG